jgi:signal transduction histidine kinase
MKAISNWSVDFKILVTAALYYLSAELAFQLALDDRASLPFWPPGGIALALVVLLGRQVWPGIAIGSLIFTVRNFWFGAIQDVQVTILVSTVVTAARTVEPLIGAALLNKLVPDRYPFSRTLDSFYFVGVAIAATLVSSGVGAVILFWAGGMAGSHFVNTFFGLWARDVVGILLFAPLVLSLPGFRLREFTFHRAGELAILTLAFGGLIAIFSLDPLKDVFQYALPFAVIPFILWLAVRFGDVVLMITCLVVSITAIRFTSLNAGPFYLPGNSIDSTLLLQIYLVVINVTALVLSSSVRERNDAQTALRRFNENLEAMVTRRTVALREQIEQRAEAQIELQRMNDELVKRNTELDKFLYSASHDLRAPISSILGLVNLARVDKGPNLKTVYLNMIEKSTRQQDHFIREIMDQSQNRKGSLTREPINFSSLIDEAFGQLDIDDYGEYQKLIDIKQQEPFYCDRWRMQVILNNLLSNAIRYRNGHTPVVKIEARVDNHTAFFRIDDNGKGISEEHLSNLGKMFYRATDQGAGSGLGLYIVQETLHRLCGSMNIESRVGEGTSVHLRIPELVSVEG